MTLTAITILLYSLALFLTVATLWPFSHPTQTIFPKKTGPQSVWILIGVGLPFVMLFYFGLAFLIDDAISEGAPWVTSREEEELSFTVGGVTAWPLMARAQQREQMRRIGVLMSAASETDQQAGLAVFKETLHQLGWIDGRNMRVEVRWARGDSAEARRGAEELVALPADVIMVAGQLGLQALL